MFSVQSICSQDSGPEGDERELNLPWEVSFPRASSCVYFHSATLLESKKVKFQLLVVDLLHLQIDYL